MFDWEDILFPVLPIVVLAFCLYGLIVLGCNLELKYEKELLEKENELIKNRIAYVIEHKEELPENYIMQVINDSIGKE